MSSKFLAVALAAAACVGCATKATVDPKALSAASQSLKAADLASMECPELVDKRDDLAKKTAGATVKKRAVDLASPAGIKEAKDMKPGETAASVAVTAAKSTIPGAGFIPLITGSARRDARRTSAIGDAQVTLARLEGVMLVKGCPISAEEAPAEATAPDETAASATTPTEQAPAAEAAAPSGE